MKTVCAITCYPTPETLFPQILTFVEIWNLTHMEKSLTQDSMHQQDLLFEKATIIFQTSRIISVFGVCDWISQTRSVFWTVHSPACLSYKFASLLHCISHLSDLTLSSILLYSKRMQHHKLIHKINNLMFSDRSKIIFYQIPTKQDYLW